MKIFNIHSYFDICDPSDANTPVEEIPAFRPFWKHLYEVSEGTQYIKAVVTRCLKHPTTGLKQTLEVTILRRRSDLSLAAWDCRVSFPESTTRWFSFEFSQNFIEGDGLMEQIIGNSVERARQYRESADAALKSLGSKLRVKTKYDNAGF